MKKLITQWQYDSSMEKFEKQPINEWIDKQEVMQLLHISARTLQEWRSKKILPFSKIRKKIFYHKDEVRQLLEKSIEL